MRLLLRWLWQAQWRSQRARTLVTLLAVAIGVALGLAIRIVNDSAVDAFRHAIATVNGEANAQLLPARDLLAVDMLDRIAAIDGVAALSPVLERRVQVEEGQGAEKGRQGAGRQGAESDGTGSRERTLTLIGIDAFSAARTTPGLLPRPAESGAEEPTRDARGFAPDVVYLSDAARARWPDARTLRLRVDNVAIELRIGGSVAAASGQVLAVMDIGSMQWALGLTDRLSRIDLRYEDGRHADAMKDAIERAAGPGARVSTPENGEQRMSNLSRAYRVNLGVLAMIALVTGGFIVFASMSLASVRQQRELALLRVLGAPRGMPRRALMDQGLRIGLIGSVAGIGLGIGLAALLLRFTGGDLGGGYFGTTHVAMRVSPSTIALFGGLGLTTTLLGTWAPAWGAGRINAVRALKPGAQEAMLSMPGRRRWQIALLSALVAIAVLLAMPPILSLPIPSYAAIALVLVVGIGLVPRGLGAMLRWLGRHQATRIWARPAAWLGLTRLAQSPASVAVALSSIIASFALCSAMLIMVGSFRQSVDQWLDSVLPADLYMRLPDGSQSIPVRIDALPGVTDLRFARYRELLLDATRAPVMLVARELDGPHDAPRLPLTGATPPPPMHSHPSSRDGHEADPIPVWVSEAMQSLHGFNAGELRALPLGPEGRSITVRIAGVWRDYARQTGAIAMHLSDYRRLSGDLQVNDLSLRLRPGAAPEPAIRALRALNPALADAEVRSAADIRRISMRIFDQSFAVTYVLEAVAILVAIFGIGSVYAGEALNRAREFGMLRHFGVARRGVLRQIAIEASAGTGFALLWGALLGYLIGLILIMRVNPQSFHWTMDAHVPWLLWFASAAALALTAVCTAVLAARSASAGGPLRAVREDW